MKPILICKMPYSTAMTAEMSTDVERVLLTKTGHEYHVIVTSSPEEKEIEFQVLNVQDTEPIDIEQLKEIIKIKL